MSSEKPVFAILGAGNGGLAMAGHLGLMGFEVRLFNRTAERLEAIRLAGGVDVTGAVNGLGKVALASDHAGEVIEGADIILVVVPATAHPFMAEACAPHLKSDQAVVLCPGRTFGAIEFYRNLRRLGSKADCTIAETQTFIYASRVTGPGQAKIFGIKNSIPLSTLRAHRIPKCLTLVRQAFPQFIPGDSVFKTSFNNIGTIFHPALMILNTGWVEDPADFEFYFQGTTDTVGEVLEKLDAERVSVAAAIGFHAMTAREWLYYAYDAVGKSLHDAVHANPGYRGILAPHRMEMRYITEDVPCSLVPMACLGRRFGVATPLMDSFIAIASAMHGRDYRAEGRTLEKLGIDEMDIQQLRMLAIGEGLP